MILRAVQPLNVHANLPHARLCLRRSSLNLQHPSTQILNPTRDDGEIIPRPSLRPALRSQRAHDFLVDALHAFSQRINHGIHLLQRSLIGQHAVYKCDGIEILRPERIGRSHGWFPRVSTRRHVDRWRARRGMASRKVFQFCCSVLFGYTRLKLK